MMNFRVWDGWLRILTALCCSLMLNTSLVSSAGAQTYTVNFKETDIEELVRFVAQTTEKTIIIDPKVKGKVQVISSKPVTEKELYDLFLSILEVHGFAAIESGNVVRIIPSRDARTAPVPVTRGNKFDPNSEIITQVIQLQNISAAKLIPILRPLAPQQAHMAAYDPSNAIIVSDTAANIARIREVIDQIDKSAVEVTEVIELEHASAEEVVRILQQLQKSEEQKGQADAKSLILVADKRTNSVLVNGDEIVRSRIRKLARHLDSPLQQSGNTRVVYLKYAKAVDLAGVLTKVVQNVAGMAPGGDAKGAARSGASASATIEADEGTNALIITAEADILSSLLSVIERLDIRRAQVLVEAIIVEMTIGDTKSLGVEWLFLDDSGAYGATNTTALTGAVAAGADTPSGDEDPRVKLLSALVGRPGQILGIGQLDDDFSFNVLVQALEKNTNANILSTPSLLTMDNKEASIMVGRNVPFKTGSYTTTGTGGSSTPDNPFTTIERQNVGITLKVTPHINEGDSMVMEISQEVSDVTGLAEALGAEDLITEERKIETQVLMDNNQTVVLGGLIQDKVVENESKVPLLGDIPLLGYLFRSTGTEVTKVHLMVFIRSTIVRDNKTMDSATAEKYSYIRQRQLEKSEDEGVRLYDDNVLPILEEWEAQHRKRDQNQIEQLEEIQKSEQSDAATEVKNADGDVTAKAINDSDAESAE